MIAAHVRGLIEFISCRRGKLVSGFGKTVVQCVANTAETIRGTWRWSCLCLQSRVQRRDHEVLPAAIGCFVNAVWLNGRWGRKS